MAKKVKINEVAYYVSEMLEQFGDVTEEALKKATDDAAKTIVAELKERSPKDTGAYAKSWTSKKSPKVSYRKGYYRTIYNKEYYFLTHILEYGYVRKNGGRYLAQPHIKKAEQSGIATFELKFLENLTNDT